jgi:hypothetical protein
MSAAVQLLVELAVQAQVQAVLKAVLEHLQHLMAQAVVLVLVLEQLARVRMA